MLRLNAILNVTLFVILARTHPEIAPIGIPFVFVHGWLLGQTERARDHRRWMDAVQKQGDPKC